MASYQDIDTRLHVVEDKVDLLLRSIRITKREPPKIIGGEAVVVTKSLLEIYHEMKGLGFSASQLAGTGAEPDASGANPNA